MSFLAGLLRRELPYAPSTERPAAGTSSALAVVPRLASRFENPGTAWWPGSKEQSRSGEGRDGTDLEWLEERDAKWSLRRDTETGNALTPGNPSRPTVGRDGAAAPQQAPVSVAGRPGIAREASAPHPGLADGDPRRGEVASTVRPAAAAALPIPVSLPAVFSAAGRLDAATASKVPLFAQATADDGVGRPRREAGVVLGLEQPGDNSPAAHSHGAAWQGNPHGQVRPRLEALGRREAAKAPEQHIHVSIGRIEVRAVAAAAPKPPAPGRAGLMSLDQYLRDRP